MGNRGRIDRRFSKLGMAPSAQFSSWQPVTATILESWVRDYNEMDGEYVREPVIKFSYNYQGREYVSDTPYSRSFTLGPRFVDLSDLAKQYNRQRQIYLFLWRAFDNHDLQRIAQGMNGVSSVAFSN